MSFPLRRFTLRRSRGGIPYTMLTVAAMLAVALATLYFAFGSSPKKTVAPTPTAPMLGIPSPSPRAASSPSASNTASSPAPSVTASGAPAASPSSPSPSQEAWPSVAASACAKDGCLSEKPFECRGGVRISNCAKCGCPVAPNGLICARGSVMTPCECINANLSIENCTIMGPGGNLTEIIPSPSPSPSPSPPPCVYSNYSGVYGANASIPPSDSDFIANLSAAYALVFNKTPSWARPNNYTWVLRDDSSGANSEIFVYKGYYAGWLQTDVVKRVLANASKCYKDAAVFAPAVYSTPWTFNFKMNCWNWRFLIDAKISDFARGSSSNNRGASLASRFADVCPP